MQKNCMEASPLVQIICTSWVIQLINVTRLSIAFINENFRPSRNLVKQLFLWSLCHTFFLSTQTFIIFTPLFRFNNIICKLKDELKNNNNNCLFFDLARNWIWPSAKHTEVALKRAWCILKHLSLREIGFNQILALKKKNHLLFKWCSAGLGHNQKEWIFLWR